MANNRQFTTALQNFGYYLSCLTVRNFVWCDDLLWRSKLADADASRRFSGTPGPWRLTTPFPSLITISWSAASLPMLSTLPEGHRMVMESTWVADPSPKCSRGSLADSKLLLARTSALCFRLPAVTSTRAPNPSRFDFLPTVLMRSQCPFLANWLRRSTGEPSRTVTNKSS